MSGQTIKSDTRTHWFWIILGAVFFAAILVVGINYTHSRAGEFEIIPAAAVPAEVAQDSGTMVPTGQVQTVNGIEIQIINVRVTKQSVIAHLCYQLPSDADWLMEDIQLTNGEETITDHQFGLEEWKLSSDGVKTHRCDYLLIPIKPGMDLSHFTISIGRLATSVPEQPDCDKVQEKLDQTQSGITIKCIRGDYYFGYEILTKPEAMREQDARKVAELAFSDNVFGPWVFTISP